MKYKLISILLLLILIIGIVAYLQREVGTDNTVADVPPTEQTEVIPEETEIPAAPIEEEVQETDVVKQEEQAEEQSQGQEQAQETQAPVENTQSTNTEPEAEPSSIPEDTQTDSDVDPGDAEQAPIPEETVLTQKDYHIVLTEDLVLDIPAGTEVTPDYLNYLEAMSSAIIPSAGDSSGKTETPPVEEPPVEEPEPYTPPTPLTDEEVWKVVNDYLDNFKTTVDMSDWDQEAIEKVDENIEIIKSDTPSSIARVIKSYQGGYAKKEHVEEEIWLFLEMGGYGSQEITVQ